MNIAVGELIISQRSLEANTTPIFLPYHHFAVVFFFQP